MRDAHSLLLITVDCLRADHTGFLGYERPTTPFMDSLAAESLVFRNAIAAGVPTYYSFPAIMASRHPLALGRDVAGIAPGETTMASAFQESGYATAAFIAGNPYLSKRFGYEAGFDTFVDFLDSGEAASSGLVAAEKPGLLTTVNRNLRGLCHTFGSTGRIYDELYFRYSQWHASRTSATFDQLRRFPAANVIVDRARDWIAGISGKPFFLWLHFMDPHGPYYPPAEALNSLGYGRLDANRARYINSYWTRGDLTVKHFERHRTQMIDLYDAGIRWVDTQIARMVGELQHLRVWDNCVMAFTADHGEEFLDHGGRFHYASSVYEELSHVPLLIRPPGLKPSEPIVQPFSLVDLAPTLLELVDVSTPLNFRGNSQWSLLQTGKSAEQPVITECVKTCTNPFQSEKRLGPRILSVRESRYKLVVDYGTSTEFLFDLNLDPQELQPLPSAAEKSVRQRLLDKARRHLADSLQSRDDDSRMAARLRDIRLEWAQPAACLAVRTKLRDAAFHSQ